MKESLKHANIPLFIPHMGCPHNCLFCDQKSISGSGEKTLEKMKETVEAALKTLGTRQAELAFFGGSFTAIERDLMIDLLELATFYRKKGVICGIRLSTRPDCVGEEILDILARYKVTSIELGIQSTSDDVLKKCGRGHTAQDSLDACQRIKARGCFTLGGQMMIGLPGSDLEKELLTAKSICKAGANECRIYPTVVLRGTGLERLFHEGTYNALTLEEGIRRGAAILEVFEEHHVKVLRMGLCAEESCRSALVAGCYHPAYGELVNSRLFYEILLEKFEKNPPQRGTPYTIYVAPGKISAAIGHKKENKEKLFERYRCPLSFIESKELTGRTVVIKEGKDRAFKIT